MKIICLKDHLKEVISLCEKITGKNQNLPILNNVLISTDNRNLRFKATNLELGLEVEIPAKIEGKGEMAVPAGIVNNFLTSLAGDKNITLESQNNNLLISILNSSTLIKGQPPEDFPILPKIKDNNQISVPLDDFILGLKDVWYASSPSNIKPEISSVFIYSGKNKPLVFVATDSFRLAERKVEQLFPDLGSLLIPFKTVIEILRIFDNKQGKIKLTSDKNQISFEWENIKLISRLTEGIFPDYKQIIPKSFVTEAIVDKNIFLNSLRTAGIFTGRLNELNIIASSNDKLMTIKTSNTEIGEHASQIPMEMKGENVNMVFNHKYVSDCLGHILSSKVLLRFSGENKPLLITGADDKNFQYLVMPMNTA